MKCNKLVDVGRRQFLRGGVMSAAGAAAATIVAPAPAKAQSLARVDYPSNRLANLSELKPNEPMDIAYPDADSPGVLLKLGSAVEGGVGPDGDVVAFSVLCPHKGWQLSYNAGDKTLNCPGHFSRFDCEAGGQQTWGHATQNLPQFMLRIDDKGDIFAEGVDELIYGRLSNMLA
ncbi:MAG: arsenate reductase (azurin) small subunit [Albidovulum sp.]|uniref:arsenate reductase (azurin) small subunit n=1 Tax=Albidovulum sp. TaxID=1872424 RepID=UPI0013263765|nr:arsenate reductase (azurin) small subunit [Defluviimonas sp.]KAB2884097.1 MAG: arsenate reductase (azurin) small subunit [Defluviimonas sp.]